MIPDPSPPFDFGTSQLVREGITDLVRRSAAIGLGAEMRQTLVYIEEQLRMRPRDWGEPSHHLKGLQMTAFKKMYKWLLVVYTVHDRIPMVTLWNVIPTSGHPLADPN
jgi:hypothetical protein